MVEIDHITRLDRPEDVAALKEFLKNRLQAKIENKTISLATSLGIKGSICWDDSFLYICIDANTWRRTALNSW